MSSDEFGQFGFAPGLVRGARAFAVDGFARLRGVSYAQVWKPGENSAECRRLDSSLDLLSMSLYNYVTGRRDRKVPEKATDHHLLDTCAHGFYAYYEGSNDYGDRGRVNGVIEGYGETVIGTRGFRCMKARIVALQFPKKFPEQLAARVRENYPSIPVFRTFAEMTGEFPPDGGDAGFGRHHPDFWSIET